MNKYTNAYCTSYLDKQSETRSILYSLVNNRAFSKIDFLISVFSYQSFIRKYALKLIQDFNAFNHKISNVVIEPKNIKIDTYRGTDIYVLRMINYLKKYLYHFLTGAYIHGSLATNEQVKYSDFDALVILNKKAFENLKTFLYVIQKLNNARKTMLKFDPLQHHGWFLLTENDLKNFPQTYFPIELFEYSKSLLNGQGESLTINITHGQHDYCAPFNNLADGLTYKLEHNKYPKNVYQLKSLLSEFMLLPTLYLQAKEQKGIPKKQSFEIARRDFSENDWKIMDKVSHVRENWEYQISAFRKWLISKPHPISRLIAKRYAPSIPQSLNKQLDVSFYADVLRLIQKFKEKLVCM